MYFIREPTLSASIELYYVVHVRWQAQARFRPRDKRQCLYNIKNNNNAYVTLPQIHRRLLKRNWSRDLLK